VGQQGNRMLGARAEKVVLARHVALSLVGRARHRARRFLGQALAMRPVAAVMARFRPSPPFDGGKPGA